MAQQPQISLIIPTRNRAAALRKCLPSLGAQTAGESFEVLVVDDGSTDGTRELLEGHAFPFPLRYLRVSHAGANAARNAGAAEARGELLLFLGDDGKAAPDLVAEHLAAHRDWPQAEVGVLGRIEWEPGLLRTPFMRFLAEPDCPYQHSFSGFDPEDVPVGRLYGSNHSVKKSFFTAHGGYDEQFRLPAFDDAELEYRYRQSGFRLVYRPDALLWHDHFYDLASFMERMRTVGKVAVQLFLKHPESILLTNLATLLTVHATEASVQAKFERLQLDEGRHPAEDDPARTGVTLGDLRARWRELLLEAMALGVQDAGREQGWVPLSRFWAGALQAEPFRESLRVTFGSRTREEGLCVWKAVDSRSEAGSASGSGGRRILPASSSMGRFLYIRSDPGYMAGIDGAILVRVRYLDAGDCHWRLDYDSADVSFRDGREAPGAFKPSREWVVNEDTGTWREAVFRLEDWRFQGLCHGADFRLTVYPNPSAELLVGGVEVVPEGAGPGPFIADTAAVLPIHFQKASDPEVSIIIPVHGQLVYTMGCLRALKEHSGSDYEVIVVDDASSDGTREYLKQCEGLRCVTLDKRSGFAVACNAGAAVARGELLCFLNNDCIPLPGWLTALRATLARNPSGLIVGAKLLFPGPRSCVQHAGIRFRRGKHAYHSHLGYPPHHPDVNSSGTVPAVTGACMLIRKQDFGALDGFDERYMNGYEDVDLCLRIAERGAAVLYCAESVLFHHTSATPGRFDHERRNRRRFQQRWGSRLSAS